MVQSIERWLGSDMATKIMLGITLLLVATTMLLAGLTIPDIVSNTESGRRTDDIAGCRAEYRADVDDATVILFDAYGDVQSGLSEAVIASIRQDPTTLALVAAELAAAEKAKAQSVDALFVANDTYRAAVELSQTDPQAFLDECHGDTR